MKDYDATVRDIGQREAVDGVPGRADGQAVISCGESVPVQGDIGAIVAVDIPVQSQVAVAPIRGRCAAAQGRQGVGQADGLTIKARRKGDGDTPRSFVGPDHGFAQGRFGRESGPACDAATGVARGIKRKPGREAVR